MHNSIDFSTVGFINFTRKRMSCILRAVAVLSSHIQLFEQLRSDFIRSRNRQMKTRSYHEYVTPVAQLVSRTYVTA